MRIIKAIVYFVFLFVSRSLAEDAPRLKCSRTAVCGVGLCCRGSDGKVIPAALQYFTEVDWWRAQIGLNPGNCSTELAKEGEFCDSFCLCSTGLLCTPNILCRTCGNICMTSEFVNKLVSYYDLGCNCLGYNSGVTGLSNNVPGYSPGIPPSLTPGLSIGGIGLAGFPYGYRPISSKTNLTKSNIRVVNNIVQLPGQS